VFAGMGGDIGENLLPEIIETINKQNIFTFCILTVPYIFEGVAKIEKAKKGIEQIKHLNNTVIELNCQLILQEFFNK
jgi:cell division protein FtsZ